ncbi:MAG: aminomethyltransferase family protein [Candidatus Cloacimonetes bacterium]|nr:aminomethyltransferase family protein [Candidatus Cloacimonadota bacterium]
MTKYGFDFMPEPRKTVLHEAEDWYQNLMADYLKRAYAPIQRSNFGQYDMAVHYLTTVLEEAAAIEKVAVYNIDHMAQIKFSGKDACALLHRVLPANVEAMKIGQCKYTLLLNEKGTVNDDLIIMKQAEDCYILVINAGHDITDEEKGLISDADRIMQYKKDDEDVTVKDISADFVKIDVQGPYSYKVITKIFGKECIKNRSDESKNMGFFTFNEIEIDDEIYFFSRTGYTNRWGWEIYIPVKQAVEKFKKIVQFAKGYGGLLVGLGGRDENRMSAGSVGLPLMGSEYCDQCTPTNAPLFEAAIDMDKPNFVGKAALQKDIESKNDQRLVLIIAEGNGSGCSVYRDGKRLGAVTSCIVSPNIPLEKRLFIGSERKNVLDEKGTAAIALAWLNESPYQKSPEGFDITTENNKPVRIKVELCKEKDGQITGKPILGYISSDGVNIATAPKLLKNIENL